MARYDVYIWLFDDHLSLSSSHWTKRMAIRAARKFKILPAFVFDKYGRRI